MFGVQFSSALVSVGAMDPPATYKHTNLLVSSIDADNVEATMTCSPGSGSEDFDAPSDQHRCWRRCPVTVGARTQLFYKNDVSAVKISDHYAFQTAEYLIILTFLQNTNL